MALADQGEIVGAKRAEAGPGFEDGGLPQGGYGLDGGAQEPGQPAGREAGGFAREFCYNPEYKSSNSLR